MFKSSLKNPAIASPEDKVGFVKGGLLKKIFQLLIVVVAVGGVVASCYYFRQYNLLKNNPDFKAQEEVETLVSAVGRLMELPTDESPTIATIADREKLKEQAFFLKSENGDKLLAYTKAMVAILYRPSTNKIINVAPIVINQPTQPQAATQDQPALAALSTLKIAYYNGTHTVGLTGKTEQKVKAAYPTYETGELADAVKKDYQETLVINLTGVNDREVSNLASFLDGKVSSLPEGEHRPDADVLVILGE